jgi:hypothetical protein
VTMATRISLPGRAEPVEIAAPRWADGYPPPSTRRVYAAAHVAALDGDSVDTESTMRFRDHLWAHGFGVAEAMDTAQRGMGLPWEQARELIAGSADRAAAHRAAGRPAVIACGAGTDQLADGGSHPSLRGYWGGGDFESAAATVLDVIEQAGDKVDGIKLSVLDSGKEIALRRRLPAGIRLCTGDDFGYADLIRGDAVIQHSPPTG